MLGEDGPADVVGQRVELHAADGVLHALAHHLLHRHRGGDVGVHLEKDLGVDVGGGELLAAGEVSLLLGHGRTHRVEPVAKDSLGGLEHRALAVVHGLLREVVVAGDAEPDRRVFDFKLAAEIGWACEKGLGEDGVMGVGGGSHGLSSF